MEERIKKFIEDNNLDFSGEGSSLNGNLTILCGFALFCGATNYSDLLFVKSSCSAFASELNHVFNFTKKRNYGEWWKKEHAKEMYKF